MASARSADGVTIGYHLHGVGEPAVVLVHGWAFDRHLWDRTMAHLSPRRRVVALDLAGHGESGADRREVTIDAFAGDVQAVVEAVDPGRAVLVGHSMSGPIVVRAAASLAGRIAGVVLVDTLLDIDWRAPEEQRQALFAALAADFPAAVERFFGNLMFTDATDPELRRRCIAQAQAREPGFGLAALRAGMSYDARPALAALRAPLRAVNGDRFPTHADALRRYVPSFTAEIVPGTGHYLMLEKPEAFNRALERALDGWA